MEDVCPAMHEEFLAVVSLAFCVNHRLELKCCDRSFCSPYRCNHLEWEFLHKFPGNVSIFLLAISVGRIHREDTDSVIFVSDTYINILAYTRHCLTCLFA